MRSTTWPFLALFLTLFHRSTASDRQPVRVDGVGNPAQAFYANVIFSYRFVQPNVQATFAGAISADSAMCRLLNYTRECAPTDTADPKVLDWASTLTPPAAGVYQRYPDLQLYPTSANAIVVVYNLNGVTDLVLTMQILARVFSGRIARWDHPDIQAANPNFTAWNVPAGQPIVLAGMSETSGITSWFRKALAGADPTFLASANWGGLVKVNAQPSGLAVPAYVNGNPYTLGYVSSQYAMGMAPMARLNRSGTVVDASAASVQYAILEKGLSFGNNGDDPAHLTGDLLNAYNPLAWPIVSYNYMAVRKSTLRPGSSCAVVAAMVDFWLWFWNSDSVATLAVSSGFSVLPEVVRDFVVARFKQDMRCNGSRVWQEPDVPSISGYGSESAADIVNKFQQAYELVNGSVALQYTTLASDHMDVALQLQAGGFLVSTTPPCSSGVYSLVLGSEAVVAVSTLTGLTLNGLTLAKILNGDITTWLDPDIAALNPSGLKLSGKLLTNATQRIVLLQGPTAGSPALAALLRRYYPAYTGAAIEAATEYPGEAQLWSAVVGTPSAFSVTAMVGALPSELSLAAVLCEAGAPVAPSLATATACAASTTYDPATKTVALSSADAGNSSCYPLLLTLYVSLQRRCPSPPATQRAVTFLQWMFTPDTLQAALDALNIVSLTRVSDAVQAANAEALFQLSCQQRPMPTTPEDIVPLLLGIIIPVALLVLGGAIMCVWWLWRVTAYNRMMRKKFSNDNVAESCAEAIARFDLDAVAWLRQVREPNKIQQSFLAIVNLLTDVKPFIPDQLLSRLTCNKSSDGEEADHEADRQSQMSLSLARPAARAGDRQHSANLESPHSLTSTPSPTGGWQTHKSLGSSDSARQGPGMRDWRRKRCAYMCVRFGSDHHHAERRLLGLAQVAGQIVDVAKAHGATIDAVGVDAVNVHWGVASGSGASALRAVQAALEIIMLRETLPNDQQAAFWLQIGVGKGMCDCGTVSSASGHRFFVVWGPEASQAMDVAMMGLTKRVLCSLLVTPSVYQEVQYTVQCMPRLWHGDVLLWEPRVLMKKNGDDEWMYELQKLNEGTSLCSKKLLEAFMVAKDQQMSAADRSAHIAQLRSLHGAALTLQDNASLDLLLAMVATPPDPCQPDNTAR